MPIVYTDEKKIIDSVEYYKLKPQEAGPHIGKEVWAAKSAVIVDSAYIEDGATIGTGATIGAWTIIREGAKIGARAIIGAWAKIGESTIIGAGARIGEGAKIENNADILTVSPIGSRGDALTIWRHQDGSLCASTGCFTGTLTEFAQKVEKTHGDNVHGRAYKKQIEYAREIMGEKKEAGK